MPRVDQTDDRSPCQTCGKPITIEPAYSTELDASGNPWTIGVRVCLNPKCPTNAA